MSTPWSPNLSVPDIHSFIATPHIGPTLALPGEPCEVFQLFFTPELFREIAAQTNLYARQVMDAEKYTKCSKVSMEDLEAFLVLN